MAAEEDATGEPRERRAPRWALPLVAVLLVAELLGLVGLGGALLAHMSSSDGAAGVAASSGEETRERVTLYIGLNDGDANEQLLPTDEARAIVDEICLSHTGGFTSYVARGGWKDDAAVFKEQTLVYVLTGVDDDALRSILDEVLARLNQRSILVERSEVDSYYYTG